MTLRRRKSLRFAPLVASAAECVVLLAAFATNPLSVRAADRGVIVAVQAPPPAPAPSILTPPPLPLPGAPATSGSPQPSALPNADRVHLHRPGTDVDADTLTGNVGSDVYVLKGGVTLHSDPTVDRTVGADTESSDPLTVTADEIDVDKAGLSYVAKGHVHFVQGDRSGSSDLAMLSEAQHTLDLIGNADVRDGDRRAAAAKMHYNTLDKQFSGAGNVRIYEPLPTPKPHPSSTAAPKHKRRLPF